MAGRVIKTCRVMNNVTLSGYGASATHMSPGVYSITLDIDVPEGDCACNATLHGDKPGMITIEDTAVPSIKTIRTFNKTGIATDRDFSFYLLKFNL